MRRVIFLGICVRLVLASVAVAGILSIVIDPGFSLDDDGITGIIILLVLFFLLVPARYDPAIRWKEHQIRNGTHPESHE